MNPAKGYYSLIQYCPNLGRLEAANVGVLLFCPERMFLEARTARGNRRIIQFFGKDSHDWAQINSFKKGLEERLQNESTAIKTLEDLKRFIALQANTLMITSPRPIKVTEPRNDLDKLVAEILGEDTERIHRKSLRTFVKERFTNAELAGKLQTDISVKVPVFLNKTIEVPYGYQNGRFNLIMPVEFSAKNPEQIEVTASKYAVRGESLYEHPDSELGALQFCVIGGFRPSDKESPKLVKSVFDKHHVRLVPRAEISALIEEIRQEGKILPQPADAAQPG